MGIQTGIKVTAKCNKCGRKMNFGEYSNISSDVVVGSPIVRCKCGAEHFNAYRQEYDLMSEAQQRAYRRYLIKMRVVYGFLYLVFGVFAIVFSMASKRVSGAVPMLIFLIPIAAVHIAQETSIGRSRDRMRDPAYAEKVRTMSGKSQK